MSRKKKRELSVGDLVIASNGAYPNAQDVGESVLLFDDMNIMVILACGVGLRYSDDIEDCILGVLGQNCLIRYSSWCIEADFDILWRKNEKRKRVRA